MPLQNKVVSHNNRAEQKPKLPVNVSLLYNSHSADLQPRKWVSAGTLNDTQFKYNRDIRKVHKELNNGYRWSA